MKTKNPIFFDHVKKSYKTDIGKKKTIALEELNLSIKKGEVFGIIGPNGAGKSTTLKILLGFVRPDTGIVSLAGKKPNDPESHKYLGYLPENPCLYDNLTVSEHLYFAAKTSKLPKNNLSDRISALLKQVNLIDAADLAIRKYSKGMVQRAALAYALIHEPEILVLDEPMSGLDPLGRQLVVDIIQEYHRKENTIIFCSHILTDVERICDRIGIMNHGRLLSIISNEKLREISTNNNESDTATPLESFFLKTIAEDNQSRGL